MVFDINAQMKLAQSLTKLTLKNMSAATETMIEGQKSKTRTSDNPLEKMMDPNSWMEMMTGRPGSASANFQPSLWWPLNPEFLSMSQPKSLGLPDLGLPNMAIPLGLNPFGRQQSEAGLRMPAFSTRSPLAGGNSPEWPNMFWWLVHKDDKDETSSSDEGSETANPWAMIMDPFGLLKDAGLSADQLAQPVSKPELDEADEEVEIEEEAPNPFQMMFDPFGLLGENPETPDAPERQTGKSRKAENPATVTALDFFDPLGLIKARSADQNMEHTGEKSRNVFFGFQPGAQHPLMNAGQPTGMFYLAIALPEEIQHINPHLPPWNLAI